MAKKGYTPEQINNKLREAEILLSQGETMAVVSKKIGVSSHTYYRWRREYGGLKVEQARKLKGLEEENARLKKLVADLSLDNAILKEVAEGNF
jgi:putative transposase